MPHPSPVRCPVKLGPALFRQLRLWGVEHVFLVPGAQIDAFVDDLSGHEQLSPVLAAHEAAAGYMADGYARVRGGIGVAMSIGGPGAANLLASAVAAAADSSPVLYVSGNIPEGSRGMGEFQDGWITGSNDVGIYEAAIGASETLRDSLDWPTCAERLARTLSRGRPAHLCVPMDIQHSEVAAALVPALGLDGGGECRGTSFSDWERESRTVFLIGSRAVEQLDRKALRRFVVRNLLPVITEAGARGVIPEDLEPALGHIGFLPHPRSLAALGADEHLAADVVITVGVDEAVAQRYVRAEVRHVPIDAKTFNDWLRRGRRVAPASMLGERRSWLDRLRAIERPAAFELGPEGGIPLTQLVRDLARNLPDDTVYCVDAGQVRRIAVSRLTVREPRTLLSAQTMAPMGWGLCAAIGASLAEPRRSIVALVGDGAMRMHGVELATAARIGVPVLFVLCDNQGYGSIGARGGPQQELVRFPRVDWVAFARCLGVRAIRLASPANLAGILDEFASAREPLLLVVDVPWVDRDAFAHATGVSWLSGPG